ncbi:MAG: hypothetical protein JOZ18_05590 [Chloroflexi bacterium]|nr:hypothetical protein [Chloroflexota bacterium]
MQNGETITELRKGLGWTQEDFADKYGYLLQGYPVRREAIKHMEKHGFPKDPMRRAIVATLLGIPLAAVGLEQTPLSLETLVLPTVKNGPIDLVEYHSALQSYDRSLVGDGCDWRVALSDILGRIQALHNKVLYAGAQKLEMVQLLCGFHVTVADIASEQRLQNTVESFNNAIILAREYKLPQHYAYTLFRRGIFFEHNGNTEAASRDFHQALRVKKKLPPQLKGLILSTASRADSLCAEESEDVDDALDLSDEAENFISDHVEEEAFLTRFDKDRWLLSRVAVRIGSPLRACRHPDEALKELAQVGLSDESRLSAAREKESIILQAKIKIDKGEYAFATKLASDVTVIMREVQSYICVHDVEALYAALKETNYGQSREVLKLGVDLLKVQRPELFPVD